MALVTNLCPNLKLYTLISVGMIDGCMFLSLESVDAWSDKCADASGVASVLMHLTGVLMHLGGVT